MSETTKLQLPLVQAAQAQKHVTVNEGLRRIDGLVQLTLLTLGTTTPPVTATEGDCHWVPSGGVNEWSGQDGMIAMFTGGGWVFAAPQTGWQGWSVEDQAEVTFDGAAWQPGVAAMSGNGAALRFRVLEFDHTVAAGAVSSTVDTIPSHAMVFGVTARVIDTLTGSLASWRLGADGSDNRFGSGLGLALGSFAKGVLGAPLTSYAPLPLDLTAEGGTFTGGTVRLAVHYAELTLPAL